MDKKSIYAKDIEGRVNEIKEICLQHGIPFFFAAAVADNGTTTEYISDIASPGVLRLTLSDDKITNMLNVMNGFDTIPPQKVTMYEF